MHPCTRRAFWPLMLGLMAGCAAPVDLPRRVMMPPVVVLEVPGAGAFFPAAGGCPALIVVRDLRDAEVVKHESGHALYNAAGLPQPYP